MIYFVLSFTNFVPFFTIKVKDYYRKMAGTVENKAPRTRHE